MSKSDTVFVLGTGPSLAKVDLDKLIGRRSFATNRIHTIYDRTKWRPDKWLLMDPSRNPYTRNDILFHLSQPYETWVTPVIAHMYFCGNLDHGPEAMSPEDVWWFDLPRLNILVDCAYHFNYEWNPSYAWHLPTVCHLGTGVAANIQVAVMEGAKRIVLLGCDLGYKKWAVNHFSPDYLPLDSYPNDRGADTRNITLALAHETAARECAERGVEILNATPGGFLEVHPRVPLEKLLG